MSVICAANILAKQTKLYTSCTYFIIFYDPDIYKMKLFFNFKIEFAKHIVNNLKNEQLSFFKRYLIELL